MPKVNSLIIGLDINRDERRRKITQRLKDRLANGMVEEVKSLLDSGIPAENLIYYGLEYKFVTQYIIGELSFDEMFAALEIAIHQFAKRQMTWFREWNGGAFKFIGSIPHCLWMRKSSSLNHYLGMIISSIEINELYL